MKFKNICISDFSFDFKGIKKPLALQYKKSGLTPFCFSASFITGQRNELYNLTMN